MRPILLLLAFLMQSQLFVVTACRPASTAAIPTALTQPTSSSSRSAVQSTAATPQIVAMPTSAITTTAKLELSPFTLTLPSPWSTLRPRADEWHTQAQQLAQAKPDLAQAVAAILVMQPITTTVVLAWPPASESMITLVAAVTPAEDVSLQSYVASAVAELQHPTPAGTHVKVESANIRYDLHPQQLPLAVLHYTLPTSDSDSISTGYQVMTIDKTATYMILLTFTIQEVPPARALAVIESIVATLQEN